MESRNVKRVLAKYRGDKKRSLGHPVSHSPLCIVDRAKECLPRLNIAPALAFFTILIWMQLPHISLNMHLNSIPQKG